MINIDGPPKILKIRSIVKEAQGIKTLFFDEKIEIKPGQFVMVWIPGVDEKPYAVSYYNSTSFGITSHAIGNFSKVFGKLKKGDKIGIRGPYGNGFTIKKGIKNSCIVAGGIGFSSVSTLIEKLQSPIILGGFRSREFVIYKDRFKNMKIATDNGSFGFNGFVTDLFREEAEKNKISMVYTCGPEIMMKKIVSICEEYNIQCQASVERYMKCGFGVCGNCMCDDKIICIDGPVFDSSQLRLMKDFGNFARSKTGKKVKLSDYYKENG